MAKKKPTAPAQPKPKQDKSHSEAPCDLQEHEYRAPLPTTAPRQLLRPLRQLLLQPPQNRAPHPYKNGKQHYA